MGTSKGYIAPTKQVWSDAKRAVSSFLKNRDSESKSKAVRKFAQAMLSNERVANAQFASSAGDVLSFARGVSVHGVIETLISFGRSDLIGKEPSEIMDALIDQFTNNSATLADSLAADALSLAFKNLKIDTPEDLGKISIDVLLRQMIIDYINISFDMRFEEKIGKGRTPDEKFAILQDVHRHISYIIIETLGEREIAKIDFSYLKTSDIVLNTLEDAFKEFMSFYGEN